MLQLGINKYIYVLLIVIFSNCKQNEVQDKFCKDFYEKNYYSVCTNIDTTEVFMTTSYNETTDSFIYSKNKNICKLKEYSDYKLIMEIDCQMQWRKKEKYPRFIHWGIGKIYYPNGKLNSLFFKNHNSIDKFYMKFDSITSSITSFDMYLNGQKSGISMKLDTLGYPKSIEYYLADTLINNILPN